MITHYEKSLEGHVYSSPVDEPTHLDAGDVDSNGVCCHGITNCTECGK